MNFIKKYWSKDEFTKKSGESYTGYVGILNENAYVYDTSEELYKNNSWSTQINCSKYYFDRILDEPLKLPYNKNQVLLSANDFLNKTVIKNILSRLQSNSDYIFKNSIISDTLVPAIDDCSVFSTEDYSDYYFVYDVPVLDNNIQVGVIREESKIITDTNIHFIKNQLKINELYDQNKPLGIDNDNNEWIVIGLEAKEYYGNYQYIPNTTYKEELNFGTLKHNSLSELKTTKTALDPTFYPIYDSTTGTASKPPFNFNEISSSEILISSMGFDESYGKYANVLLFLVFETQIVIIKLKYYVDNFEGNKKLNTKIDFITNNNMLILDRVDPNTNNSINFLKLSSVNIHKNYMLLVDSSLNMVLRYDITWLLSDENDDNMFNIKNLRLLDNLQGDGNINNNVYFNNPSSVIMNDDYIYVSDSGNNCIKLYSSSFDYIRTIRNSKFSSHTIQTVSLNPYEMTLSDGKIIPVNSLWVFSINGSSLYITILDNYNNLIYSSPISKIKLLEDKYTWDEKFKSVKFSFNNSNYFYICTTKRVYKVHLSKPNYPFASLSYFKQRSILSTMIWNNVPYPWHLMPAGEGGEAINITWGYRPSATSAEVLDNKSFSLTGNDSTNIINGTDIQEQFNGDLIFHVGTLYDQSKIDTYITRNNVSFSEIPEAALAEMITSSGIYIYNETASFISSVTDIDVPCYTIDDIEDIFSEEYVNPITFNKCTYKVIYNLINLKNILIGKFQGGYNLDNIMVFDQLIYDDYFQNLRIENNSSYFIHDNEPTSIILNRVFENIYNLQDNFLKKMEAEYVSSPNLTNNSFRII